MTIGEKLSNLRKSKNLSQQEVAEKLNVSRQKISKWETDQSMIDVDKIVPICELYGITADELLNGKTNEEKLNQYDKNKSARSIGTAVFLYILSIVFIIFFEEVVNVPVIGVCLFFISIAIATLLIVYNEISNPKEKKKLSENVKNAKIIGKIISLFTLIIYLIVSFSTMAWHITWLIFLIGALIEQIVKLLFSLKEDSNE